MFSFKSWTISAVNGHLAPTLSGLKLLEPQYAKLAFRAHVRAPRLVLVGEARTIAELDGGVVANLLAQSVFEQVPFLLERFQSRLHDLQLSAPLVRFVARDDRDAVVFRVELLQRLSR